MQRLFARPYSLFNDIHIPQRFNKLLTQTDSPGEVPLKSVKPMRAVVDKPLSTSQKRLLSNIEHSLIDILQNDPLPRQLLFAVRVLGVEYVQGRKRVSVRWEPESIVSSMHAPTHRITPPAELSLILQKMSVLFRELIVQRLGHGVCSPSVPPLDFKLYQKSATQQELERRIRLIEQEKFK